MDPEDGCLFVCDVDDDVNVTAFAPLGVEYPTALLNEFKSDNTE